MSFVNLDLNEKILKAVEKIGFKEPTLIQIKVIPEIISGNEDIVGLAQTGTGKTAAFGLPMIQLTDFNSKLTQGVVICPTRELCIQITKDFKNYAQYCKGASILSVYGGTSIDRQIKQLRKGVQIIVATPGRLLDLINRKVVNLSHVAYVVLDEADEMLNMGFKEDLDEILSKTPDNKRTWLFSATMPREVARIARKYMTNPIEISAGKPNAVAANIQHINYVVMEKDRYAALKRIIDYSPEIFGLVFCRTRRDTHQIAEKLGRDGYNAEALHGDISQSQRDNVMWRFRSKSIQILVATDVAARGLDVDDITHVINYNLPDEAETYTHRSGRTARAGKSGISIILMNTRERRKLIEVERKSKIKFTYGKVPDGNSICEKQLYAMIKKLVAVDVNNDIEKFLPAVYDTLQELSKEELIQRFISAEFNRFLDYYKNSGDINAKAGASSGNRGNKSYEKGGNFRQRKNSQNKGGWGKNDRSRGMKTQRFFINSGSMDKINEGAVIRLLCDNANIKSSKIGKIDIMREFSFFEVEQTVANKVLKSLKGARLDGRSVTVQFAKKKE